MNELNQCIVFLNDKANDLCWCIEQERLSKALGYVRQVAINLKTKPGCNKNEYTYSLKMFL